MRKVRMPRSRAGLILIVVCAGAAIAGITRVVQAAIPDGSGIVHGCYSDGTNGSTILNGSGAPGSSVGVDGDFYLDISADVLYGPKSGGAWPATGTSLIGPKGETGATGPVGPANLAALQGSACTVNGHPSTLQVSIDNTTGAVSLICAPEHEVSAIMNGVADPRILIQDNGNIHQCNANTCSTLVQTGDQVAVSLSSGDPLAGGGAPFVYSCNGGPTQTAREFPFPQGGSIFAGTCPTTGFATITADYSVNATGT